jgi:cell division transport system permease protein
MITFLGRTLRFAFTDFWRNFWLSLITVTIVFIALFSVNSLLLIKNVSDYTLQTVEKKIDVSVFITPKTDENIILDLRARLLGFSEVKEVIYISADESLQSLRTRHANDETVLQAVEELGENPLGAQLIIQANSTNDYAPIIELLNEDRYDAIIADKNFDEHTYIIERVSSVTERIRSFALALSILFGTIAIIVVFNTLRVIIYTHREEIAIMRLVGATTWFIRMPYLWQSVMYAVFALGGFILIWYPIVGLIQPYVNGLFADGSRIDLIGYYSTNFFLIFGAELGFLILILGIASIIATQKHSKV